jgi:Na+/proline symporter/signal transduction histidine kinase
MTGAYILAILLLYMAGLFLVAWRADRTAASREGRGRRKLIYSLSLAVLCTSWTYFGAVGTATRDGWAYLPNYLGPILALVLFFPIWQRIAIAAKRENVGSIADFLSSRYGRSRPLGIVVALVAILGALPYIALQLSSLSRAWAVVAAPAAPPALALPIIVAVLAGFAILFGARRANLTAHSRGLVRVVAIESVVKIVALAAVAVLAVAVLLGREGWRPSVATVGDLADAPALGLSFMTATLLCMVTAITLPRQFHLSFVELEDVDDLKAARWQFPLYMFLAAITVPPIVAAGRLLLNGDPDMYVLGLPMQVAGPVLTGFVLVGGFSAGASMVMVETVAVSAMISNELVLPLLARLRRSARPSVTIGRAIVNIRRAAIMLVLLLGWAYYRTIDHGDSLANLGFTSLAASAQLLPALVGAVIWRRGHSLGAVAGIVGGIGMWACVVAMPQLAPEWPLAAPGRGIPFEVGVLASLVLNICLYIGVSFGAAPRLVDLIQAHAFVGRPAPASGSGIGSMRGTIGDLRTLVEQFLGRQDAHRAFEDFGQGRSRPIRDSDPVDALSARAAERMLAGAIGASSARSVIQWVLADPGREPADIGRILDEAAHAVQFSRELLQVTLDSLAQAVVVVDADLRLVAWNDAYLRLLGIRADIIHVGQSLEDLIRHTSHDDPGDLAAFLESRFGPIRRREPQDFEHDWNPGLTLRVVGQPLASGEYVTSFTDVTELRASARALRHVNEELENRVRDRTRELTAANTALAAANMVAEKATRSQARFVAAASHDLLQPLNAARLFVGAVAEATGPRSNERALLRKADLSIEAADSLLRALLNLSRLELDGVTPTFSPVAVGPLLQALHHEFAPLALGKGIRLRMVPATPSVLSDPDLLRSVLQNLIGNAVRYTLTGSVAVVCRREGDKVRIEVRDSGPGIAAADLPLIFKEFQRLPSGAGTAPGTGLGLAIAERICGALGHALAVRSKPGQGSVFSVTVRRADSLAVAPVSHPLAGGLKVMKLLCVEDDPAIQEGLLTLLLRWGMQVEMAGSVSDALQRAGPWDVVLADFHLGDDGDGLQLIKRLGGRARIPALITASREPSVLATAAKRGVTILPKPLAPASLRSFLHHAGARLDDDELDAQ